MRLMVLSIVFAMSASVALADDWRVTTYDDRGAVLTNVASIRQLSPNVRVAWTAHVWSETNERGVDYNLLREEYDCVAETTTNVALVSYDEDGSALMSSNDRQMPMAVIPGSVGAQTFRDVCSDNPQFLDQNWQSVRDFLIDFRTPGFDLGF